MDQARLLIAIALSLLVFLVWSLFYGPERPEPEQQPEKKTEAPMPAQEQPVAAKDQEQKVQEKTTPIIPETEKAEPSLETTAPLTTPKMARTITVDTPLYQAKISENGAAFYTFLLKNYRETVARDAAPKQILTGNEDLGVGRLGFAGQSVPGLDKSSYVADLTSDQLKVTDSSRELQFSWRSDDGILIVKKFTFLPNSYLIGLAVTISNGSNRVIQDKLFVTLNGNAPNDKRLYAFEGPSALINNQLEEIKIKKIKEQNTFEGKISWIALQSRYFMSSIIPYQIEDVSMRLALPSDQFVSAQYVQPEKKIQPGTRYTYEYQFFMGPKRIETLKEVGNDLQKVVDFGWFDFIARPCLWLMNLFYSVIPNYGVAIIILTLLVKILLWPLGQ